MTIIQGDPGEGKTTMVLQIIAKLTKGEPVLPVMDGEEESAEQADVYKRQGLHSVQPPHPLISQAEILLPHLSSVHGLSLIHI